LKRKIGDIILVNIGTQEHPKILKIGAQCSENEKQNSWIYSVNLEMFFPGHMRIFVVLILMLSNMLFLIKEEAKPVRKK
jgi:hypothetical protein